MLEKVEYRLLFALYIGPVNNSLIEWLVFEN